MIRVYDEAGNVIETHEHMGDFKDLNEEQRGRSPSGVAEKRRDLTKLRHPTNTACGDL